MSRNVAYHHVTDPGDPSRDGFVNVYKSAFSEAPYFEHYETEQVINDVWLPHVPHCVFVAHCDDAIIGLGCGHPVVAGLSTGLSTIGAFLTEATKAGKKIPFPLESTVYMSELAVLRQYRGHGVGTNLVRCRWEWAKQNGFTHYCMRTAEIGSNSRALYEEMGALQCSEELVQDVTEEGIETQSSRRIILYGAL